MSTHHRFAATELDQYFDRISLPKAKRIHDVSHLADNEKLAFLNLLQKHQLVKVPWENLTQHYSWHHVVHVKPKHLFRKIVHNAGRGGYCFEVNQFYHMILYSMGFNVYMCGSRIYSPPKQSYGGWTHVVNVVIIAGIKYLLDGGYGPPGPSRAVPLNHGVEVTQIAPAQMRLLYDSIPQNLNPESKVWIYQSRYDETAEWTTNYCFPDFEFTPEDISSMNFDPWLNSHTFFTHKVVAVRFTTVKESDGPDGPGSPDEAALEGEVDGAIVLNHDALKWRRNGKKVVDIPFKSETGRVDAIKKYFGIELSEEDVESVAGTAAQIGAQAMGDP